MEQFQRLSAGNTLTRSKFATEKFATTIWTKLPESTFNRLSRWCRSTSQCQHRARKRNTVRPALVIQAKPRPQPPAEKSRQQQHHVVGPHEARKRSSVTRGACAGPARRSRPPTPPCARCSARAASGTPHAPAAPAPMVRGGSRLAGWPLRRQPGPALPKLQEKHSQTPIETWKQTNTYLCSITAWASSSLAFS